MDFTHLFIESKYLEAIGWTLTHSVWQIGAISLGLWLLLQFIPKKAANVRYMAALLSLGLVCTVSAWTWIYEMELSEKSAIYGSYSEINSREFSPHLIQADSPTERISEDLGIKVFLSNQINMYLPYLVNLWILGALFYWVRLMGSLYDLNKLHHRHHETASPYLLKKVSSITASLGIYRKVTVLKSTLIHTPITYGILKPVILLPGSLAFHMPAEQLEAIIAHELAHIKRHDYLTNIFQSVLEILFFYHPGFWWINNIIMEERENATDDLALSLGINAKDLALGLAEVANHSLLRTPEMALAASSNKQLTLLRIKRILGRSTPSQKFSPLMTITMILSIIITSMLVVGAQSPTLNQKTEPELLTQLKFKTIDINETLMIRPKQVLVLQDTVVKKKTGKSEPPSLELTPVPKMDFQIPQISETPPIPPTPMIDVDFPSVDFHIQSDTLQKIARQLEELEDDDSPEAQSKKEKLQSALKKVEENLEALSDSFSLKMEHWEEKHGESFKKFEMDMELWEKKMEEQEKIWESTFAPKMKEFEEKMKEWEKENAPRIKEFEEKMKNWHKDKEGKIESMKSTESSHRVKLLDYLTSQNKIAC